MKSQKQARLQHKQLYLTYNDSENKIQGPMLLIDQLREQLKEFNPYYAICCHENAPTTGMSHYHILMLCNQMVRTRNLEILTIQDIHPHVEPVHNNLKEIIKYIKKGGIFAEFNKDLCPVKVDKLNTKEKNMLLLSGDIEKAFLEGTIGSVEVIRASKIRYIFASMRKPTPYKKKLVMWFQGETGEGKTRKAVEIAERFNLDYWMTNDSLRWFDGFHGQDIAIIDDFRKSMLQDWNYMLRLLDGYNLDVQVKGGFVEWNPKIIIITTPATPQQAFQWVSRDGQEQQWDRQDQLERRLTHDDELQVYEFPLWREEEERLERTLKKFLGIAEEEQPMIEEDLELSPIMPEPTQDDEA